MLVILQYWHALIYTSIFFIDFHEVQSALTRKLFKGRTLVVEPVPVSATVLVQNLPQNPPSSTDMLSNYFENKRRSGGGDVTNVEFGDRGKYALITFADAKGELW